MRIAVVVNGDPAEAEVWEGESLLYALREHMGLPGSKNACEQGECGSCSVLLDGTLVCACLVLAAQADGHEIMDGRRARVGRNAPSGAGGVSDDGWCSAGLHAWADRGDGGLLARVPQPTDDEIREALSGNLCGVRGTRRSSTRSGWRRAHEVVLCFGATPDHHPHRA